MPVRAQQKKYKIIIITQGKEEGKGEDYNYSIRPKFQMGDLCPFGSGRPVKLFINPARECLLNLYSCLLPLDLLGHTPIHPRPLPSPYPLLRYHPVELHGPSNFQ